MSRGLLIGRFQPPHLGHLQVINELLKNENELVIVIAAAQMSFSIKNPFTAGERMEMIRIMLQEHDIQMDRIWIVPVQDVMDNDIWVSHLLRMIPKIDNIYGNNPFTRILFEKAGHTTINTKIYNRRVNEASGIRKSLTNDEDVSDRLSKNVITFIDKIKGRERLKTLISNDSPNSSTPSSVIN